MQDMQKKKAIMSSVDPVKEFEGKMMAAGRLNVAKSLGGEIPPGSQFLRIKEPYLPEEQPT